MTSFTVCPITRVNSKMGVSETAYLVCELRNRCIEISQDKYAASWIPDDMKDAVSQLTDNYMAQASPNEDIGVSLRCRYFKNQLQREVSKGLQQFVNIPAGFTSYSLELPAHVNAFEFDLPEVIEIKRKSLEQEAFSDVTKVPALFDVDLLQEGSLEQALKKTRATKSVVFLEGISYYLTRDAFDRMMALIADYYPEGSVLVMDYWDSDYLRSSVFLNQSAFFGSKLDINERYLLLDKEDIEGIQGFEVLDMSHAGLEAAKKGVAPDKQQFLPENYVIMEVRGDV